jgi:SAM-dependent methyltransferase
VRYLDKRDDYYVDETHISEYFRKSSSSSIEALFPEKMERVLDVGCGSGTVTLFLKKTYRAKEVFGVELDERGARVARRFFDGVIEGDVEKIKLPFPEEHFDCIVYADILEHLVDPWRVVREHAGFLKNRGIVIVRFPNVRNLNLLAHILFQGEFLYEEAGLLDRGHIRFFTTKSMVRLLAEAGYRLKKIFYEVGGEYRYWEERGCPLDRLLHPSLPFAIPLGDVGRDQDQIKDIYARNTILFAVKESSERYYLK